jgi:hypothetical protein
MGYLINRFRTEQRETTVNLQALQQQLRTLATLNESEAPVISCYVNLESGTQQFRAAFEERLRLLKKSLSVLEWNTFSEAIRRIDDYLHSSLLKESKGAAIFARGGAKPFFLPLQFRVPVPDALSMDTLPNIFHLVELKDTYHRFVLMISTEERVRIVEVSLGEVTEELWREMPELRKRVGREWTKEHYQSHKRDRGYRFIKEKVEILDRLMAAGGHTHLILAGNRQMTARVRNALPEHLLTKLIDTVSASGSDRFSDVVAATLSAFVEQEERESLAVVEHLQREIKTGGLATAGTIATWQALERRQVDVLVMAKDYEPEPNVLNGYAFLKGKAKEALVRLAEQVDGQIEIVSHSDILMQLGGVGALLRYRDREATDSRIQAVTAA